MLIVGQDRARAAHVQSAFPPSAGEIVGTVADCRIAAAILPVHRVDLVVVLADGDLHGELACLRCVWRGGLVVLGPDDDGLIAAAEAVAAAAVFPPYAARQVRAALYAAPALARELAAATPAPAGLPIHLPTVDGDTATALYARLLATWPDLVCVLNRAGIVEYVSDSVEQVLGYRAAEVVGQDYRAFVEADDLDVGRTDGPADVATRWRHRNGASVHLKWWISAASAEGRSLWVGQDLTPFRRMEAALLASEERYRLAGRAANDILWDWDLVNRSLMWGDALYARTGLRPEQVETAEEWWYNQIHPDDRARVQVGVEAAIDGTGDRWSDEYRLRRADGSYFHVLDRGLIVRDARGRAVRMVGSMVDITELRAAEAALAESEARYRLLAKATKDVVWSWNLDADVVTVSATLFSSFAYPPREGPLPGAWWATRVHPDDAARVSAGFAEALSGEAEVWSAEYRFLRGDGNYATVLNRGYILREANGAAREMIGSMFDLTPYQLVERQLEESQRRLEHAQKMEAVGRLAGGVAHDFNNLLTVIGSYGDLAFHKLAEGDPVRRYVGQIRKATATATVLTRQLLALSRRQVLQLKVIDLNELVEEIGTMVRSMVGPTIQLRINLDPELGKVEADASQLNQVLLNLIVNAKDAMPDGGVLVIETRNFTVTPSHALQNPQIQPGSYLRLTVADSGVGMDQETLSRIFEPFFTTKPAGVGTGLGLATVYGIVQQSRGSITVYSELGRGTTFHIYLPRVDREAVGTESGDGEAETPGGVETVLVVEDEAPVRDLVKLLLTEAGYHVLAAAGPEEALQLEAEYLGPVDVLLTDVVMPRLNGPELARELLLRRPTLRTIFMSGYTEDVMLYRNLVDTGVILLEKPFAPTDLLQIVRHTLDHSLLPAVAPGSQTPATITL